MCKSRFKKYRVHLYVHFRYRFHLCVDKNEPKTFYIKDEKILSYNYTKIQLLQQHPKANYAHFEGKLPEFSAAKDLARSKTVKTKPKPKIWKLPVYFLEDGFRIVLEGKTHRTGKKG